MLIIGHSGYTFVTNLGYGHGPPPAKRKRNQQTLTPSFWWSENGFITRPASL